MRPEVDESDREPTADVHPASERLLERLRQDIREHLQSQQGDTPQPADWPALRPRFETVADVQQYVTNGVARLAETQAGRAVEARLSEGTTLQDLVEDRGGRDVLTRVAGLAREADVDAKATGTLVHRVSELRQLHQHAAEVVDGTRLTEQRIDFAEDGQEHAIELDTVIQRGEHHYIRDNKPIRLETFETTDAGEDWNRAMTEAYGSDFRTRIAQGELNPFGNEHGVLAAPTRQALREYLSREVATHRRQLERYAREYARARGLDAGQVQHSVRPYWVFG